MKIKLTPSKIERLRARSREYIVWDSTTPHLGVRVKPTGAMRFIHLAKRDGRLIKTTIGEVGRMCLDDAREIARDLDSGGGSSEPPPPCPTFGEWVEDVWWPQTAPHLKETTRTVYRRELDGILMPEFSPKPLNEIGRTSVLSWFERYSRSAPGGANKVVKLLSSILNHAVRAEIIPVNPVRSIKRNPRRKMTRFLDDGERERLLASLDELPEHDLVTVMVVKMLLFTGCRCGEIRTLKWCEVGDGKINLAESKTGARTVWLGAEASAILDEAKAMRSGADDPCEYVFPSSVKGGKCLCPATVGDFWRKLRKRIDLDDVRIHDLRHSFATEAVRQGVPLPVVSKLLGHSDIKMTMRYAHTREEEIEAGSELIGHHLYTQLQTRYATNC